MMSPSLTHPSKSAPSHANKPVRRAAKLGASSSGAAEHSDLLAPDYAR